MSHFFQNFETPINLLNEQAFAANQRGRITHEQQKKFLFINWKKVAIQVFIIAIVGCMLGLGIFLLVELEGATSFGTILFSLIFAFIFLVLSFFTGYVTLRQLRHRAIIQHDYENGAIRQGQGKLVYGKKGY